MKGSKLAAHRGLKKMVVLRTKTCGIGLFDYLFIFVVILGLLCYYMLNWALWIIRF